MENIQNIQPTQHTDIINPLLTDNYQITMAYTYFLHNRHNQNSVFEAFFRKCPFGTKQNPGQYAIFAGVEEIIKFVKYFKITVEQIAYLRQIMPHAKEEFFTYLENLDCRQLTVHAMKEGQIVFPHEPLIKLEGPLGLIQLIETPILNLINFPTLIATNASRMKNEAGVNKTCLEFGLRRAQGPDGGLSASQYSYLGGFDGSSNVLAGMKFKIPISGTMAHSYVTSYKSLDQIEEFELNNIKIKEKSLYYREKLGFQNTSDGELAAFIAYARSFPDGFVSLVDTYNVLESGVPNFLCVAFALDDAQYQAKGIRLDSGNLAQQSIQAKQLFEKCGNLLGKLEKTQKYIVVASNDINEDTLVQLKKDNHQIDSFGIGTQLVTCSKQPALGMVYKLVSLEGEPKHKVVSDEPAKSTLPGGKNVFRIWTKDQNYPILDVICQDNEILQENTEFKAVLKENQQQLITILPTKVEKLLVKYWVNGKIELKVDSLQEAREFSLQQKSNFNQKIFDNQTPEKYQIMLSENYLQFFQQCTKNLLKSLNK